MGLSLEVGGIEAELSDPIGYVEMIPAGLPKAQQSQHLSHGKCLRH